MLGITKGELCGLLNINSEVKEEIADRIAMAMVNLWTLQFEIHNAEAHNDLIHTLRELKILVNELGGNPATDAMPL